MNVTLRTLFPWARPWALAIYRGPFGADWTVEILSWPIPAAPGSRLGPTIMVRFSPGDPCTLHEVLVSRLKARKDA